VPTKCPVCDADNTESAHYCSNCAAPLKFRIEMPVSQTETLETPPEEFARGTVIAERYEIIETLGRGGMGQVYRVYDKKIEGEVALKIIKPEIASSEKTIERFRNELKLAREISHRNICRMYDLNEENGIHFITMEYVPGENLKSFIRRSELLSIGKTMRIAKQICEGLAEAHRKKVIHRDLKSSNIMIDNEGNARIMDFGIARSIGPKEITDSGMRIGTPEYMSPEQADARETDHRSDIYSFGIILYEMLTGRLPFEGDTSSIIVARHKREKPENPKTLNTQIPDSLNRLVLKCLEKTAEQRYPNAETILRELEDIEEGITTIEKEVPRKKPVTSKEITVSFSLKKLLIPSLFVVAIIAAIRTCHSRSETDHLSGERLHTGHISRWKIHGLCDEGISQHTQSHDPRPGQRPQPGSVPSSQVQKSLLDPGQHRIILLGRIEGGQSGCVYRAAIGRLGQISRSYGNTSLVHGWIGVRNLLRGFQRNHHCKQDHRRIDVDSSFVAFPMD
jgi:serine/threonine protein kinase